MTKTAIVIYSDQKANLEEALGRVFNGMYLAYERKEKNQGVAVIFQGTGVRWVPELANSENPANPHCAAVSDKVVGDCLGCADVFGATEDIKATDEALVGDKAVAGTSGGIDLLRYLDEGYRIVTF